MLLLFNLNFANMTQNISSCLCILYICPNLYVLKSCKLQRGYRQLAIEVQTAQWKSNNERKDKQ